MQNETIDCSEYLKYLRVHVDECFFNKIEIQKCWLKKLDLYSLHTLFPLVLAEMQTHCVQNSDNEQFAFTLRLFVGSPEKNQNFYGKSTKLESDTIPKIA